MNRLLIGYWEDPTQIMALIDGFPEETADVLAAVAADTTLEMYGTVVSEAPVPSLMMFREATDILPRRFQRMPLDMTKMDRWEELAGPTAELVVTQFEQIERQLRLNALVLRPEDLNRLRSN